LKIQIDGEEYCIQKFSRIVGVWNSQPLARN
jgi:hypothetical protein